MENEDLPNGNVKLGGGVGWGGGKGREVNAEGGDISEGEFLIWIRREKIVWRAAQDEVVSLQRSCPSV